MNLTDSIKNIQRAVGVQADGAFGPATARAVLAHLSVGDLVSPVDVPAESLDARTLATLATLDAKARDRFESFTLLAKATAATLGCEYVAISGHRTWEEQDKLFAQRPRVTKAAGGYSNHNFGIATDYGVFKGKLYIDEAEPALAERVHRACAAHASGCGLEWGGNWKSFRDIPHYEIATGLTMEAKRLLYKQKGSVL